MLEHGETDGERARGLTGGRERERGSEGRAPKINPSLRHVHKFHVLFIGCSTEAERMANKKFRRALRPVFRYGSIPLSELWPCVFLVLRLLHMFPRVSVGSGPWCFLFLKDGLPDFIAAGLGLVPRGGQDWNWRCNVCSWSPSRLSNG